MTMVQSGSRATVVDELERQARSGRWTLTLTLSLSLTAALPAFISG